MGDRRRGAPIPRPDRRSGAHLRAPPSRSATAGVWAGVDVDPTVVTAAEVARRLVARGVLVDVVGDATIVLVPPLVIRATELDWAIEQLRVVLAA
ncbi:hypothetical protein [Microbacterium plantarum]|uniref:hypothetical protein n=1 Tax=Microbacterium plantarum TaxID=1816425 RepID=UPI002B49816F|nr:hypothetical protein [Microbacterium plantarum]WRK17872.1 hypothetical protein VC184_02330 [Microbacterium plantarum]